MISHQPPRKDFTRRNCSPRPTLEFLENRQLLSTVLPHALPSYNLTGSLLPVTLPRELAGQPLTGAVTVAVKNAGTLALPAVQKVNLTLIALGATKNVTLETLNSQSVSSLAIGGSKNFSFDLKKATVPPVGDYTLEVVMTPTPALKETSTADNLITTTAALKTIPLHVVAPDLTGLLLPSSLPALLLAGSKDPVQGTLSVRVQNIGNIALPANEQITLQIRAHNVLTGQNYTLNANPTQKYSVSGLGIAQTLDISPTLQFTGKTFPAGHYTLQALITPVQAITESSTTNNLITANAAGQPTTLVSQTAAAPDLTGLFANSTVQTNANGTTGNLTITLTNAGTATLVGPQPIAFAITARSITRPDIAVALTTLPQNFSISNLKVGQSVTFTIAVSAAQLNAGSWMLAAGINVPGLTGPTTGNLIAVTKTGGLVTLVSNNAPSLTSGTLLPPGVLFSPVNQVSLTDLSTVLKNFGAGTLTTSATNVYTGSTTVSAGNVLLPPPTTNGNTFTVATAPVLASGALYSATNISGTSGSGSSTTVLTNYGTTGLNWTNGCINNDGAVNLAELDAVLNIPSNGTSASNTTTSGSASLTSTDPTGGVLIINSGNPSNATVSINPTGTTPNPSDGAGLTIITLNPGDGTATLNLPPNIKIGN